LKAKRQKLNILGTIRRQCQECGKHRDCTNFDDAGKIRFLCSECIGKEYVDGKRQPKKPDYKLNKDEAKLRYCDKCGTKAMKEDPEKTWISHTHIHKKYVCGACGHIGTRQIKKWSR